MKYFPIVICLLLTTLLSSQEKQELSPLQEKQDSTIQVQKTSKKKIGMLDMFTGNPGRAALYSAILPGAGQAYNKRYWKIPIVLAAEGAAVFFIFDHNSNYKEWKEVHIQMSAEENPLLEYKGATTPGQAKSQRDKFEGWRDNTIIATAVIHLVQIADAFVNRHLMEFDVSEDLSFSIETNGLKYGLVVTF